MNYFGVKGKLLAEVFGCSPTHLSKVRNGKTNPPINEFWRLIETMDELAPGSKKHFCNLIGGYNEQFLIEDIIATIDPEELVYNVRPEDLYELQQAANHRLKGIPSMHLNYIELADERDLPTLGNAIVKRLTESKRLYRLVEYIDDEDLSEVMIAITKRLAKHNKELQECCTYNQLIE